MARHGLLAWQAYLLCFAAGVWSLRHPQAALASAGLVWLGLVLFRRPAFASALASLALAGACLFVGQQYASFRLPQAPSLPAALGETRSTARVFARVAEVTDKPFGRLEILLKDARAELLPERRRGGDAAAVSAAAPESQWLMLPGRIAWDWDEPGARPAPGQSVEVVLRVRPVHGFANFGGADFEWRERLRGVFLRAYTRGPDIEAVWGERPAHALWDLRESLRGRLLALLPETPGGAVLLGLLLGDRSRIGLEATEDMRAAGLSHTLALSGLNVVYVALLGLGLAWLAGMVRPGVYVRIPRQKLAVLLSLPLVAAYVWLGQGSPSLVRAALMYGSWGILLLLDRGRPLVDGLFLAVALMLVWDPLAVYDLGLQMSVAAVAGLAFLYPWLDALVPQARGRALRLARRVWQALALTLSANLALLPISLWCFGTYPPNFLLNLAWVPVQGMLVQLPGMAGLALAVAPGAETASAAVLSFAALVQGWMLDCLHLLAARGWFPTWAVLRPLWPELLGASALLAAASASLRPDRPTPPAALALCGLLLVVWPHALLAQDEMRDAVRLSVLDVGQSQAVVVEAPGGRRVLVDGGGAMSPTFDIGRSVVAPALAWGRPPRLDAVVMTHPDADHAQGLAWILRHFRVGAFYTNGRWPEGRLGLALDQALAEGVNAGRLAPRVLTAGERLDLGEGVVLEVLHPADGYAGRNANDESVVLRLVWRGQGLALLPGDIQRDGIEAMLDAGVDARAAVLLLPHHGSKSSLSGMLYEAVAPDLALASCGFLNQYRFPNADVAAELAGRGIPLAATPWRGMLRLAWAGPGREFGLTSARP
ncbi:DNA internalization-related competence protein ComEC/Rec2 [Humidesulfovibrio mexicanus]|nr:DNA internalization-related competence protein ComEC/Rec2 [Humidesulfovibrio mexicanus]